MKIDEFILENKKLERLYEKELTEEQTQEWYKALKDLTATQYKYVVSEIYRTISYFPKLAQVLDVAKNCNFEKNIQNNKKEKVDCDICKGNGFVLYEKYISDLGRNYEYLLPNLSVCHLCNQSSSALPITDG